MAEDYMNCAIVRSGEEFSVSDFARCYRTYNKRAREILDDLAKQHKLSYTMRHGCCYYRKRPVSLVNTIRLSNYEPPRPEGHEYTSRWVTVKPS